MSFLGFANFYSGLIYGYSSHSSLTRLTDKMSWDFSDGRRKVL